MEPYFWDQYLYEEPICKKLVENWTTIRDELIKLNEKYPQFYGPYPKYKVIDPNTQKKVKMYENNWTVGPISKYDEHHTESHVIGKKYSLDLLETIAKYRRRLIPTIHSIITEEEQAGNLANSFVSILEPGIIIRPHQGYSNDFMRIHLGLICDPECKITVGEETRTWEEGKLLAFKDGGPHYHSVVHNGTEKRYIFSVDLKLDYLKQYIKELN